MSYLKELKLLPGLVLLILLGGITIGVLLNDNPKLLKTRASNTDLIQFVEPKEDSTLTGFALIKATATIPSANLKDLSATLKVSDKNLQNLRIIQDASQLNLSTLLDTTTFPNGSQKLEIVLYSRTGGKLQEIGRSNITVAISN